VHDIVSEIVCYHSVFQSHMPTVNILVDLKGSARYSRGGGLHRELITNFLLFTRITIISHVREFKAPLAGTGVREFK
jgi:hypothetical protein